jgi:hypothetical protein
VEFDLLEWLTGPKPLVSAEEEDWQIACFEWLLRNTGGFGRFANAVAVLPTDAFFPQKGLRFPVLQLAIFEQIKAHAGMREWRCAVEVQQPDPNAQVSRATIVQNMPGSPAGTFRRTVAGALITYNPTLLSDPMAFIATMAHELAHFLLSEIQEPPPGGVENLEFATDMAAVFLGFGVFLLNSAFTFSQTASGTALRWSARRQGYLSEAQLVNALAIFTRLLDCEPRPISSEIKSHFRRLYKLGLRDVGRSGRLHALRSIAPLPQESREIPAPMSGVSPQSECRR